MRSVPDLKLFSCKLLSQLWLLRTARKISGYNNAKQCVQPKNAEQCQTAADPWT